MRLCTLEDTPPIFAVYRDYDGQWIIRAFCCRELSGRMMVHRLQVHRTVVIDEPASSKWTRGAVRESTRVELAGGLTASRLRRC
jgi:hypothetical protein